MNLKPRWVGVHSVFWLSVIHELSRVLAYHSEALPVLRCVSNSASTRDRAFGSPFATSSGVTAYRSLLWLLRITANAISKSIRSVSRTSTMARKTASSWCLLCRWKGLGRWKISTVHSSTLFICFFDNGLLSLVINHSKYILSILWSQFLPDEKTLSPSLPRVRIGIRKTLLDVSIYDCSVPVKHSFKWIDTNKD